MVSSGWEISLVLIYFALLLVLSVFGTHRSWMVWQFLRNRRKRHAIPPLPAKLPKVLVQLPLFNERYVAPRLIRAVAEFDYPRELLEIQVLDDSTDDTPEVVGKVIEELAAQGVPVRHIRRNSREGFKAGALDWGLKQSDGELIAIFDADFIPSPDFLQNTVGFFTNPKVGMVQTRWEHLNRDYSLLTRTESVLLDGHFVIEHTARHLSGCFFNFNGTAGIWRRQAIETAGGWQHDTLTEDLDLSYRAQALGWQFIYLTDVSTPAEVPVDVRDFKTQQHRWTKGAIQVARKLLPMLWRSKIPLRCKIEASFHLLSNACYLLMVLTVLMLGPVCVARAVVNWQALVWLDIPILLTTTVSVFAFYLQAERAIGRNPLRAMALMPVVMSLGIGIAVNNAFAVIEGLHHMGGEFIRTPKYKIETHKDQWVGRRYAHYKQRLMHWVELFAFLYAMATGIFCAWHHMWFVVPFVCIFIFGFGYVVALNWIERWHRLLTPAPAEG